MLQDLISLIKELLFDIFGDAVYDLGLKHIAMLFFTPFFLVFLYFLYRFLRRSILQPIAAYRLKLDQIATTVADNNRMLQILADNQKNHPDNNDY